MKSGSLKILQLKPPGASIILVMLALVGFYSSCTPNQPQQIKTLTNGDDLPSMQVFDLTTTITDSGRVSYRFTTPEMSQFDNRPEPVIKFPQGLHLFIFGENEQIDAQVKSKFATYHQEDELWELRNEVEAVNLNGDVINTELLFWDRKKQTIYSDAFIKITTSTEIITGYGFEGDERLENYKIRNVSGILHINEQQAEPPE